MAGINRCTFIGNLGKDPELKTFSNGGKVCNVSLACSETWKDKDGNRQERTEWVNLTFNDKLAEIADQYLRKGSKVYVEGKLRTRKYEKDGTDRYVTEVRVETMQMLDGKPSSDAPRQQREPAASTVRTPQPADFPDDDIPF